MPAPATARWRSPLREAVRIRARVAALQVDLVRAFTFVELQHKPLIKLEAAVGRRVELGHPALDALRIELLVPARVQRVRDVDARGVATHLDHLRSAGQPARAV